MKRVGILIMSLVLYLNVPMGAFAQHIQVNSIPAKVKIPGHVYSISKDNTYPNPVLELPSLEPSSLTKKLIGTSKITIENPDLIKILNETSIKNAPLAVGYRASIFLGEWPLCYHSKETTVNWEYQRVNTNYCDNRVGKTVRQIYYSQDMQRIVRGGLTSKVEHAEEIKKMMLLAASKNTGLPLAFDTIIGAGTKKDQIYNVQPKTMGYIYAYVPAVNERGKVTFGEVYLILKGNQKSLEIRNITSLGIGSWIPVQEYLTFGYVHRTQ